jgi:hypothetical protein
MLGRRQRRHPSLEVFADNRWSDRDRAGRDTLRLIGTRRRPATKSSHSAASWPPRVTGLMCKGVPVITVCNPALWEYSGDNIGS